MRFRRGALLLVAVILAAVIVVPNVERVFASVTFDAITTNNYVGFATSFSTSAFTPTAGEEILFEVSWNSAASLSTITDTQGNTYTTQVNLADSGNNHLALATASFASAASDTVTVTFSASTGTVMLFASRYLGVTGIGASNSATASATNTPSMSLTTQSANSWIVGGIVNDYGGGGSGSITPGGSQVQRAFISMNSCCNNIGDQEDLVTTTAQSYTLSFTISAGGIQRTIMGFVEFKGTPPPDFSLSNNAPANGLSIVDGQSGTIVVTATMINGALTVTFSCVSPPSGITCSFSPASCTTTCTTTLTVSVAATVNPAFYTLTIQGVSGATTHTTSATIQVVAVLAAAGVALGVMAIILVCGVFFYLYFYGGKRRRRRR